MHCYGIILAAGSGQRFGNDIPKQYLSVNALPLLSYPLQCFLASNLFDGIFLVYNEAHSALLNKIPQDLLAKIKLVKGGSTRTESSQNALKEILKTAVNDAFLLFHDAARANVYTDVIRSVKMALDTSQMAVPVCSVNDTLYVLENEKFSQVADRKNMRMAQTPQGFHLTVLKEAYEKFCSDQNAPEFTDDISMVKYYCPNSSLSFTPGHPENIKLTHESQFKLMECLLNRRQ